MLLYHRKVEKVAQRVNRLPAMWETWVQSLGQEDPLEKEMATHSSILAWEIPWTEDPGELQSTGLPGVGRGLGSLSENHSVMSNSFATPWIIACQPPLVHGILQAGVLEWVAIPFSRGSS